jgi:hypothetical protein
MRLRKGRTVEVEPALSRRVNLPLKATAAKPQPTWAASMPRKALVRGVCLLSHSAPINPAHEGTVGRAGLGFKRLWFWLGLASLAGVLAGHTIQAQTLVQQWEGIRGPSGFIPPDSHGAPGAAGIIATVNLQISYFTKSGGLIWGPTNFQNSWRSVGNTGSGLSDPKVVFDPDTRRLFVIHQENTDSRFWLNLAVSRSADPRTAATSDWLFYRLDATAYGASNPEGGTHYSGDYLDSRALYATYRMYTFTNDGTVPSWPSPALGHWLQQSSNFGATSWTSVSETPNDDGKNKSISPLIAPGRNLYRLK